MFAPRSREENFLPAMSRSSSERSSSSSGSAVSSKNYTFPRGKLDGFLSTNANDLWTDKQMTLLFQDIDQDPPLWDMDIKDPSCAWDLELSQKLATKLLVQNGEERLNDNFNPYEMPPTVDDNSTSIMNGSMDTTGNNPRFKTEICRNFKEKGSCLYGDLCQFAHGKHELRKDVVRHNKYKTKHCQKYWIAGYCAYGPRCNFIHQEQEDQKFQGSAVPVDGSSMDILAKKRAINPSPMTMKTAAQVMNLANLRKLGMSDSNPSGESSGSEDGKQLPFSRGPDYDLEHYLLTREEFLGLEKFPTFVPRGNVNMPNISQFGSGSGSFGNAGPVGSGRPRVVWPGA